MGSNRLPRADEVLAGRDAPMAVTNRHHVHGRPIAGDFPGLARARFGMGCFWGAERKFWSLPGVFTTAVGYAGGTTPNPTYREVCSGLTGHAEVVLVLFDRAVIAFEALLQVFFESHDPTQGMRQGNDVGTQYRSAIYTDNADDLATAQRLCAAYGERLRQSGWPPPTTEIRLEPAFFYAEDAHQQYLSKYPDGYCGLRGTGISCAL